MKTKYPILVLLLTVTSNLVGEGERPIFNIEPQDVQSVQIELEPKKSIQVRVFISSLEKLKEWQKLQNGNFMKPVIMQVSGERVELMLMFEAPNFGTNTSFAFFFNEMEDALELVYRLLPERRPIQSE